MPARIAPRLAVPVVFLATTLTVLPPFALFADGGEKADMASEKIALTSAYLLEPLQLVLENGEQKPERRRVRIIRLTGVLNGTGKLVLDANHCTLTDFGDPGACTLVHYAPYQVRIVPLRLADPLKKGRLLCDLRGVPIREARLQVVVPRRPRDSARLLVKSADNQTVLRVITLERIGAGNLADPGYPVGLGVVPEMQYIPEVDSWTECDPNTGAEHAVHVRKDWRQRSRWVAGHLTPALARALSRWAQEQMQDYHQVPGIDNLDWKPVRQHEAQNKLVFEGIVDTLPVHAPQVTRWLKLYLLYDKQSRSILGVTITIRGERLE